MEKPFGTDLASAKELNDAVHAIFDEDQVFRIDHFLGKEAAQNILAFRFANGLFEPIWNRDHIDHVQIDVPETLSVDDRVAFYEATGAFKDMVVTHLFQILAFMAMEPPTALESMSISEEKNKVFRSLRPLDVTKVVRGQYDGYRDLDGVAHDSDTETFVALECEIDNWRWSGVPFYLRTGKELGGGERIISIAFREPPKSMFPEGSGVGSQGPDHLTFDLADSSKLSLSFYGKKPGMGMRLEKLSLQFALHETGQDSDVLEAYERLIHDAMAGDHTLFNTAEGIERLWEVATPLAREPAAGAALRQGKLGTGLHQRTHRSSALAPALRAALAGSRDELNVGRVGVGSDRIRPENTNPEVQAGCSVQARVSRRRSGHQHHPPEGLAALDVGVRPRGVGQREGAVDDHRAARPGRSPRGGGRSSGGPARGGAGAPPRGSNPTGSGCSGAWWRCRAARPGARPASPTVTQRPR